MHFLTIGWKVLFSIVPPPHMMGGWACFVISLVFIGLIVVVVGATAELFGCVAGLRSGLNAVTLVAIGTSLPDTFASKTAAEKERYADAAIGNITGSNCVNVFLGLGLPWMIGSIWYHEKGLTSNPEMEPGTFYVPKGSLVTSVIAFLCTSVLGFIILITRRVVVKGELGGSSCGRFTTAFMFFVLWIVYVTIVAL